ncbi:hypothetical protein MTsDn5_28070 [Alteromonas gracilis]|jgi:hypothetical protein
MLGVLQLFYKGLQFAPLTVNGEFYDRDRTTTL